MLLTNTYFLSAIFLNLYKNKIPTTSFGGIAYDGTPPSIFDAGPSYLTAVYVLRRTSLAMVLPIGTNFPTTTLKWCVTLGIIILSRYALLNTYHNVLISVKHNGDYDYLKIAR